MLEDPQTKWYYKIVYFFIANQILLRRLGVVVLVVVNIAIWWPAGVKWVNYGVETNNHQQMLKTMREDLIDWQNLHILNAPEDLEIESVDRIRVGDNKYALVAKIINPNPGWFIPQIDYAFIVDGSISDWQTNFILPASTKYLLNFSYSAIVPPQEVDIRMDKINWRRIKGDNKSELTDSFTIEDKNFTVDAEQGQLDFKITNNSLYGFWQTGWQIVLYSGTRPVAVNYVTINNFKVGETREVSVAWSDYTGSPSSIDILPEINLFDASNYITSVDTPPVNLIKGAKTQR